MGDKAQEKLTPDSQKSATDKASEAATNTYDKAASMVQPGMSHLCTATHILINAF